jgi:hypothetical protein
MVTLGKHRQLEENRENVCKEFEGQEKRKAEVTVTSSPRLCVLSVHP